LKASGEKEAPLAFLCPLNTHTQRERERERVAGKIYGKYKVGY